MTAAALSPRSRAIVRKYAVLNPWIQLSDLCQEAALAALTADPAWEPHVVALALSRYVAEQRCPVSLPKRKGESWREAAESRRAPLSVTAELGTGGVDGPATCEFDPPDVARVAADAWEPADVAIDRERAIARVRAILAEQAEAARLVLLAEEKSSSVAARLGVSVREVYDATAAAMRALRAAFAMEAA